MKSFKSMASGLAVAICVLAVAPMAQAADGAKVWKKCKACHTTTDKNKVGPGLAGVVGRKCGEAKGYKYGKGYKKACEKSGFVVDEKFLMAFLLHPNNTLGELAGGKARSKMTFKLKKEDERKAVIEFLKGK